MLIQADLTEQQLLKIATDYLPEADAFILPRLVPAAALPVSNSIAPLLPCTRNCAAPVVGPPEAELGGVPLVGRQEHRARCAQVGFDGLQVEVNT